MSVARMYGARTASRAYRDHARQRRRAFLRGSLKWLLYAAAAFLLCAVEGTVFAFRGASVSALGIPFLLPAWLTAVAMYEGFVGGAWFGIAVGLLSSAAGGDAFYVLPLLYMLYGLSVGMLGMRFLKKGFFIYAVYEIAVCIVHGCVRLLISVIAAWVSSEPMAEVLPLLWAMEMSDILVSMVWGLPLYLPSLLIRRLSADRTEGQDPLQLQ